MSNLAGMSERTIFIGYRVGGNYFGFISRADVLFADMSTSKPGFQLPDRHCSNVWRQECPEWQNEFRYVAVVRAGVCGMVVCFER
jgi:hypothetical protein